MDFPGHQGHPNRPDSDLEVPRLFLQQDLLFRSWMSRAQRLYSDLDLLVWYVANPCLH